MSEQYLSEIRMFSFGFAPKGWVLCNGQILPINQYQALFALIGTTYGGNGQTTFALPNLQGRVPHPHGQRLHRGATRRRGQRHINIQQLPQHNHVVTGECRRELQYALEFDSSRWRRG